MANKERTLYDDHLTVYIAVDSTTVVEKGDFICIAVAADEADDANVTTGYGCPPTYLVDAGTDTQNRAAVDAQLLGIALSASANGETAEIAVGTNGTFILDQKAAAAIHIGDNIEPYASATNGEAQTIVEGDTSVIGTCIKTKTSTSLTEVYVLLQPVLMNV